VDILAGKITIDKHGNAVFNGDVEVRGQLAASELRPIEGQDMVINLANLPTPESQKGGESSSSGPSSSDFNLTTQASTVVNSGFGKLLIKGANNEIVASIDASGSALFAGDLLTSGSGTFKKLIIAGANSFTEEALSPSKETKEEFITNATTGIAILPANKTETTIKSPFVTESTLIYITPISSTQNNVLYIKAKRASLPGCLPKDTPLNEEKCGWFKVGVDKALPIEVKFNWWIIN